MTPNIAIIVKGLGGGAGGCSLCGRARRDSSVTAAVSWHLWLKRKQSIIWCCNFMMTVFKPWACLCALTYVKLYTLALYIHLLCHAPKSLWERLVTSESAQVGCHYKFVMINSINREADNELSLYEVIHNCQIFLWIIVCTDRGQHLFNLYFLKAWHAEVFNQTKAYIIIFGIRLKHIYKSRG